MSGSTGIGRTYLTFKERTTSPPTPASTYDRLFFKADGLHYINSAGTDVLISGPGNLTSATDPATDAAATAAIVSAYSGTIITTTTTGNSQALGTPTTATVNRIFTVINNDTSTDSIPVVANSVTYTITPGEAQNFVWDGTAWGPYDLGITAIPVVVAQGGTGASTAAGAIAALIANVVDTTLSGTPKVFTIYDGATPYYFKAYPTKV
ncbi:MAG: hypothetical protein WC455_19845 [Dehalococcoidia bacterium]|jgi:hypothetical protein